MHDLDRHMHKALNWVAWGGDALALDASGKREGFLQPEIRHGSSNLKPKMEKGRTFLGG